MNEKITKKTSIIFNQLWIVKAIEDGNYCFLISKKVPGMSIGEVIETKYEEFDAEQKTPKITKRNSLLFQNEWISKYKEENRSIPRRKRIGEYSLGEILELNYFDKTPLYNLDEKNKIFQIKMGSE